MSEQEIQYTHNLIYEYLSAIHAEDTSFIFRLRKQKDDRFKKGYWFTGNDSYLNISFWAYDDTKHQTPIMRLCYLYDAESWNFELVARDGNRKRYQYFEKLAKKLDLKLQKTDGVWSKEVALAPNCLIGLHNFIAEEKLIIDNYIKKNPLPTVIDFISNDDFNKDQIKIEESRNYNSLSAFDNQVIHYLVKDLMLTKTRNALNLPNSLMNIYVSNFQGIKEISIEDIPNNSRWIFFTGENGFGKTSILRAISKGLVGEEPFVLPLSENSYIIANAIIMNNVFLYIHSDEWRTTQGRKSPFLPVAAYGVSRFQLTANDQTASDRSKQKTYSLFHDDGQLLNIEQELITSYAYNRPRFDALKSVFLRIIPNLNDIKIDNTNGSPKVRYQEKNEQGKIYDEVSLNELAAGYRSILTMIGDMMIRLSEGQKNMNDLSGIVLIDEIDAHLHPKYQYELPKLLSDVFPKVQFIVTTHSPIPILGLPEDNKPVILTVERSPEKGITVERKDEDFDIRQLNPQSLLTSPIFGFQTLFARGAKADNIIASDDFKDVEKVEKIRKRLQELREKGSIK